VAHADLFPSFQHVNNQVLKGAGHASRHGRAHFGRLVNAADMGEKLPRILALVFDTPN